MSVRPRSVLGLARELLPALLRARERLDGRSRRGQMAVVFVAIIALIFLLAAMTMNLGEVARLRTSTANAADAGSLAGASWVASGENEVAEIAKGMWLNILIVQAVFAVPFCWQVCWLPLLIWAILWLVNGVTLKGAADMVLHAAWDNAHAAALFTAIQNATIDDPTGAVQKQIKRLGDQFGSSRTVPPVVRLDWERKGAGGIVEPSWAEFSVQFTNQMPELEMEGWAPSFTCLTPCLVWLAISNVRDRCWFGDSNCCVCFCIIISRLFSFCPGCIMRCFKTFAWTGVGDISFTALDDISGEWTEVIAGQGPAWLKLAGVPLWPAGGDCEWCLPIRGSVTFLNVTPSDMKNPEGDVIVNVKHHREGRTDLRFWETQYPDQIVSESTAHYEDVRVTLWPDARSFAQLVSVR